MRTKNMFRTIFLAIVLLGMSVNAATAAEMKRTIMGIYNSSGTQVSRDDRNFIHNYAETPLNYLGYKLRFHDLAKGLPSDKEMEDVTAVLAWLSDDTAKNALDYIKWAKSVVDRGIRYIILGGLGAYRDKDTGAMVSLSDVNDFFNTLGLSYGSNWTDNPLIIDVVKKDSSMVEFERSLKDEVGYYELFRPIGGVMSYLVLKRKDMPDSDSSCVAITANGAFVERGYDIFINYIDERAKWYIDPFKFFEEALRIKGLPRFDTTTLFGRRILYSHIDGDGMRNLSFDMSRFSSEVILEEILKKYNMPITASFITADVDVRYFGNEKTVRIARDIAALENVEIGVHGFTHPLDWKRKLTVYAVKGYSDKTLTKEAEKIVSESLYDKAAFVTVSDEEFLDREISSARDYLDKHIVPAGKKTVIYQWTGDCEPQPEAIDKVNAAGLRNINGGDTRFDEYKSSYTGVAPLFRQVNGRYQTYTSNANENIYTNGWTGPFDGYEHVITTMKETEVPTLVHSAPRRITPMNIYYHYFIADKEEALESLKAVYNYCLKQEAIPIFTSHYADIADGFLKGKIEALEDGGWRFYGYGACRTVRFDGTGLYPDMIRSKNVLGFKEWNGYLYVHLGDMDTGEIYLTGIKPAIPYLSSSSVVLEGLVISSDKISFKALLFNGGDCVLSGLPENIKYRMKGTRSVFTSDDKGQLVLKFKGKGKREIELNKE